MDDSDVEDGEGRGLSTGDTEEELLADESAVTLRCSAVRFGRAVEDMSVWTTERVLFFLWMIWVADGVGIAAR